MSSKAAIEDQVERIVRSDLLSRSPSLCRFLRFIVSETLEGRGGSLKEYVIGVQVFDRDSSYDTRIDPIVRVQARKLRVRLSEYYEGPGAADPLLIDLPKGGYAATISPRTERLSGPVLRRRYIAAIAAAGLVAAVVLFGMARLTSIRSRSSVSIRQLTFGAGAAHDPAISPDGQLLAYSADRDDGGPRQIWIASLRSGEATPITCAKSNHITPDFSPNGKQVVFRSFENGGGIFVAPVHGGEERKIVDGGFRPRLSPDGTSIAYVAIEESGNTVAYVAASSGGQPVRVSTGTTNVGCPVWHSEGRHIAFIATDPRNRDFDVWVTKFPGGEPVRTRASEELRRAGADLSVHSCLGDWNGDRLTVQTEYQAWQLPLSIAGKPAPPPLLLLPGPVLFPRAGRNAAGGHVLVYTVGTVAANIWSLPIDANSAVVRGPLEQVTRDAALRSGFKGTRPTLSADAVKLAYDSDNSGNRQMWLREMASGRESRITSETVHVHRGLQSSNGAVVAFEAEAKGRTRIYIHDLIESRTLQICESCGHLNGVSSDGRQLLIIDPPLLKLLDSSGSARVLLNDPKFDPQEASLSPDGKWIALVTGETGKKNLSGYVIPLGDTLAGRVEWIPVTEEQYELSLHWSPDGNLVYFLHQRDGFRCLWAQRLNPHTKRPIAPAFTVQHFHASSRYPMGGSWLAVARDRIVMTLSENRSNIWMANFGGRLP